jgi:hypothetical protein
MAKCAPRPKSPPLPGRRPRRGIPCDSGHVPRDGGCRIRLRMPPAARPWPPQIGNAYEIKTALTVKHGCTVVNQPL